jgi:hypothetical protein
VGRKPQTPPRLSAAMSYDRKRSHRELKSPMLLSTPLDDTDPS